MAQPRGPGIKTGWRTVVQVVAQQLVHDEERLPEVEYVEQPGQAFAVVVGCHLRVQQLQ